MPIPLFRDICVRSAKAWTVQKLRTFLIDGLKSQPAGNALTSDVTAARMHTTTPANSGVIS